MCPQIAYNLQKETRHMHNNQFLKGNWTFTEFKKQQKELTTKLQ